MEGLIMFIKLVCLPFLILALGCVYNPKYTGPEEKLAEPIARYPQSDKDPEALPENVEQRKNQSQTEGLSSTYEVTVLRNVDWDMNEFNPSVRRINYRYQHKISLTLVCGSLSADTFRFSRKNIKWKIGDDSDGEAVTDYDGKLQLLVDSRREKKFESLVVETVNRSYLVDLRSVTAVELDARECERRN